MSEWIRCEDRMPEEDGRYLVTEIYDSGKWVGVCSLRRGKWDISLVKYWKPLPTPPKSEEQQ